MYISVINLANCGPFWKLWQLKIGGVKVKVKNVQTNDSLHQSKTKKNIVSMAIEFLI